LTDGGCTLNGEYYNFSFNFFIVCIAKEGFSHDIEFYATIFPMRLCNCKVQRNRLGVLVKTRGSSISNSTMYKAVRPGSRAVNGAVKQSTSSQRSSQAVKEAVVELIEMVRYLHNIAQV
jgi:hypothetical protein